MIYTGCITTDFLESDFSKPHHSRGKIQVWIWDMKHGGTLTVQIPRATWPASQRFGFFRLPRKFHCWAQHSRSAFQYAWFSLMGRGVRSTPSRNLALCIWSGINLYIYTITTRNLASPVCSLTLMIAHKKLLCCYSSLPAATPDTHCLQMPSSSYPLSSWTTSRL
jgi:hypothetical protein